MNFHSAFNVISDITQQEKVSCILIGGFAINYYKVTRQTTDIDFLITKEDFDKIYDLLKKTGYKQTFVHEAFAQLKSEKLSMLDIDFMFIDKETFYKIKSDGRHLRIAGKDFVVPSLNHLLALKLHSIKHNAKIRMTKDLPDIVSLIRINDVNADDTKFKELCLKYGNKEIYHKILDAIK